MTHCAPTVGTLGGEDPLRHLPLGSELLGAAIDGAKAADLAVYAPASRGGGAGATPGVPLRRASVPSTGPSQPHPHPAGSRNGVRDAV